MTSPLRIERARYPAARAVRGGRGCCHLVHPGVRTQWHARRHPSPLMAGYSGGRSPRDGFRTRRSEPANERLSGPVAVCRQLARPGAGYTGFAAPRCPGEPRRGVVPVEHAGPARCRCCGRAGAASSRRMVTSPRLRRVAAAAPDGPPTSLEAYGRADTGTSRVILRLNV
jgi:hypothetical protein